MREEYLDFSMDPKIRQFSEYHVLRIGTADIIPGQQIGPILLVYHLLSFVREGTCSVTIDGVTTKLKKGDAYLVPADKIGTTSTSADESCLLMWIAFTGTRADQVVTQLVGASERQYVLHDLPIESYEEVLLKGLAMHGNKNSLYFQAISILLSVFGLLARDIHENFRKMGNDPDNLVYDIRHYLDMNYPEKLLMQDVADKFCIHPNYMARVFKEAFGVTPKQYLQSLKMKKACILLQNTDLPILVISRSLSFPDQLAFTKAFHKTYGISPTRYRKEHLEKYPVFSV